MVKQICFFCSAEIGSVGNPSEIDDEISHGLCPNCVPKFMAGHGCQFGEFLDRLPAPIFVIDEKARVVGANAEGLRQVNKSARDVQSRLGGEVFECRHAKEPGGCGQTIHCKTCTIRNTVTKTLKTGETCLRVPAYMDLGNIIQERTVRFLISTEKVGEVVLLRIDAVEPNIEAMPASSSPAA